VASKASEIRIETAEVPSVTVPCAPLEPYAKTTVDVTLPAAFKSGETYTLAITTGTHLQEPTVFTVDKVKVP